MSKKAEEGINWTVVGLILALIFLFLAAYYFIYKPIMQGKGTTEPMLTEGAIKACKVRGDMDTAKTQYTYCGNNVYPISCSPCLGAPSSNLKDDDGDGILNACEINDQAARDQKQKECKAYYTATQCCISNNPCPGITCVPKDQLPKQT